MSNAKVHPSSRGAKATTDPEERNREVCLALITQLWKLRQAMLSREVALSKELSRVSPEYRASARNLIHYLTLRNDDLRPLQEKLSWLGLSSLGRSESHVLANLDKVLGILHRLTGQPWQDRSDEEPVGSVGGRRLLEVHATQLLGEPPSGRGVRIMVTLPSEAAGNLGVVRGLVEAGMDIARINCAHDGPDEWKAMALHVRHAAKVAGRAVKILMDLGGPKIRTGDVQPGPAVLKVKPQKDEYGRVFLPARIGLLAKGAFQELQDVDASIGVDATWLRHLKVGAQIDFSDARGARRHFLVAHHTDGSAIVESLQTAYLTPETVLSFSEQHHHKKLVTSINGIDPSPGLLHLQRGDLLRVTRSGLGRAAVTNDVIEDPLREPAQIACTLPEVLDQVQVGERIWFDDGKIGGEIRQKGVDWIEVEILQTGEGGSKLVGDKGINLPDSVLSLPALTPTDIEDLESVARDADMVGLSFVQSAGDVDLLREHLHRLGRDDMGIVLKIETTRGFERLPELMLSAMAGSAAGVMIARGDLAVECGYERLVEVQEEILWCAEAAHMPVIWATQVLETLAKTGTPSRAEISDAGLGVRAECVMLNKGPYISDAINALDDILRRMEGHQAKKRPLLRALRAWRGPKSPKT